jgi:hypothetical protein
VRARTNAAPAVLASGVHLRSSQHPVELLAASIPGTWSAALLANLHELLTACCVVDDADSGPGNAWRPVVNDTTAVSTGIWDKRTRLRSRSGEKVTATVLRENTALRARHLSIQSRGVNGRLTTTPVR